jgi:hypothetical protein
MNQELPMRMQNANRFTQRESRWSLRCAVVTALLVAGAGTAFGQTARSFEEMQERGLLEVGDAATVQETSGKTFRGIVSELGDGSLTLRMDSTRSRTDRVFTEADVRHIRRAGSHVMAISGLAGAVTGFGITAAAAASYGGNEGVGFCGGCLVEWSTLTVPIGAGFGALVGFAIDLSQVKTVYARAPGSASFSIAPVITKRTVGGIASIRF